MHCIIVSVFNDQWSVFPKDGFVRGGNLAFSDRVGGGGDFALCTTLSRQCSMINDQCSGTII